MADQPNRDRETDGTGSDDPPAEEPIDSSAADVAGTETTGDQQTGDDDSPGSASRRALLGGLAAAVGLAGMSGTAAAHTNNHNHLGQTWTGDPGTQGLEIDVGDDTEIALLGTTASPTGTGVEGRATSPTGATTGVRGFVDSGDGGAVGVRALAPNGNGIGLRAEGSLAGVSAVGDTIGLVSNSLTPGEPGIIGQNFTGGADEETAGVWGITNDRLGAAVRGDNFAQTGINNGVRGSIQSDEGSAVFGTAPSTGTGVRGSCSGEGFGMLATSQSGTGIRGTSFGERFGVVGTSQSGTGVLGFVRQDVPEAAGVFSIGDAVVVGDLQVTGSKSFVHPVSTDEGSQAVSYKAVEAADSHTEVTDVGQLSDGRAEIDLPDHFAMVTSDDEELAVQTTPRSTESNGLAVVDQSLDRIVVEDLDGTGSYEFTYTVTGVREGHADEPVMVDEPELPDVDELRPEDVEPPEPPEPPQTMASRGEADE